MGVNLVQNVSWLPYPILSYPILSYPIFYYQIDLCEIISQYLPNSMVLSNELISNTLDTVIRDLNRINQIYAIILYRQMSSSIQGQKVTPFYGLSITFQTIVSHKSWNKRLTKIICIHYNSLPQTHICSGVTDTRANVSMVMTQQNNTGICH